jgi:uncharacterized protein (DUF885 family)
MLPRLSLGFLIGAAAFSAAAQQSAPPDLGWIKQSNEYTNSLLSVQLEHSPERGSAQGVAKFDERISDPSRADEVAERRELEAALAKVKSAAVTDKNVKEDIVILQKSFNLQFRQEDFSFAHEVPFLNASSLIFQGLRGLLDDQVPAQRRPAALVRLRKYAGVEPGYKPFTDRLKEREVEQISKPGVIFPSKEQIETEMGRNSNYVAEIPTLFKKYNLTGWEPAYEKLKAELSAYDAWVKNAILPKARADFRIPPEKYALAFESYGIDIAPAQIAKMAHAAFTQYQSEMAPLAVQVAKTNGYGSNDYRSVIAELKKKQITGAAILPFFENRLHEIEKIILAKKLVSLPNRPAIIRLASAAETAQNPAPHMSPPPFLHNTGQRGQFVLPLSIPSANGGAEDKYDDFTFDAVSWTLIAHEARPGHELQFDSMVEHGVSLARALYAFNSTNAEGWGLYAEYIMQPYEPVEGQLLTLQLRLLRAARAFLDPELQSGAVTEAQAYKVLEQDVLLSHAFAKEEVERYTFNSPGQANSYFYGYTKLLSLRKETETALGDKFDQKRFHDFLLGQGLLPPDLMRTAVLEEFIPSQR